MGLDRQHTGGKHGTSARATVLVVPVAGVVAAGVVTIIVHQQLRNHSDLMFQRIVEKVKQRRIVDNGGHHCRVNSCGIVGFCFVVLCVQSM